MKYFYMNIILLIWIASGCSNDEAEEELKKEIEQLKQENASLSVVKEDLELDLKIANAELSRKNDQLTSQITSLQMDLEMHKELINRYEKVFEFPLSSNRTIADTLSIFSPNQVKTDSEIAGLIVSERKKEDVNDTTGYFIKFTGEFKVRGSIIHDTGSENEYSFIVKENLETMPHTLEQFEKGTIYFDIANDEDLRKALDNILDELSEEDQLDIVAVFKNYSYNEVPETDFLPSHAEFVRVVSEN